MIAPSPTFLPVDSSALPEFPEIAWRGLFAEYRTLIGTEISECPLPFHFANLLSVIAAELGDRFRLQEGKATYLNFYLFCCGRTGTKKSTASDLVQEHSVFYLPLVMHSVFTSVSSAEGLARTLAQYPNSLLRYDEIADLFATASRSGQRLEPDLNKAFDLRQIQVVCKKNRDSIVADDYYLNILANGTPDHVRLQLSEALMTGGLFNRFLVFSSEPSGLSLPVMGTPDAIRAKAIANKLGAIVEGWHKIAPDRGSVRIGFTPEARAIHETWYHAYTKMMQTADDLTAKPLTRLDVYSKKLAGVYCIIETPPCTSPLISASQMSAALAVIQYCQASMLWVTSTWTGQKTVGQQAEKMAEDRVQAYLREHGCTAERGLYRYLHLGANECKRAVDALAGAGVVTVIMDRPRMVHFVELCKCFR